MNGEEAVKLAREFLQFDESRGLPRLISVCFKEDERVILFTNGKIKKRHWVVTFEVKDGPSWDDGLLMVLVDDESGAVNVPPVL